MGTVETKLRQKPPYFLLIVENINYVWVLLIDNILVYKLMKCYMPCHVYWVIRLLLFIYFLKYY